MRETKKYAGTALVNGRIKNSAESFNLTSLTRHLMSRVVVDHQRRESLVNRIKQGPILVGQIPAKADAEVALSCQLSQDS